LFIVGVGLELCGLGAVIAVLLLIESMIIFAFFLWIGHKVFFGKPSAAMDQVHTSVGVLEVVVVILAVLCLTIHFFAIPVIEHIPLGM